MRKVIIAMVFAWVVFTTHAKPHCQSFNNYDNKTTIVFTDDEAGDKYEVTDVKFIPKWKGKEYKTKSVSVSKSNEKVTVMLCFPHLTQFSNPKVELRINGKKTSFKVCQ